MQRLLRVGLAGLLVMAFMVPMGCDRARSKFDQVQLGMTRAEVVKILGEPQEKNAGDPKTGTVEVLRWRLGDRTVVLQVTKERVTGKQLAAAAKKKG